MTWKITDIPNRFEFCFCLNEKVISGRPEKSCMYFTCKILPFHFENKNGAEKKHWKATNIDRYIKYITTCRFLPNQYYLQIGYVID